MDLSTLSAKFIELGIALAKVGVGGGFFALVCILLMNLWSRLFDPRLAQQIKGMLASVALGLMALGVVSAVGVAFVTALIGS